MLVDNLEKDVYKEQCFVCCLHRGKVVQQDPKLRAVACVTDKNVHLSVTPNLVT